MTLLHTMSLTGSVAVVLYLLLHFFTKRYFPASWHKIYMTVTIFLFLIPFAYFKPDYVKILNRYFGYQNENVIQMQTGYTIYVFNDGVYVHNLWLYLCIACSLILSACSTIYFVRKYRKVFHTIAKASSECEVSEDLLAKLKQATHVPANIKIYVSDYIETPVTLGILRQKIVLPNVAWTEEGLTDVIHHEFSHIKVMDNLLKFILLLTVILNFYNPLVYYLWYQWNLVDEMYCDEKVTEKKNKKEIKAYANLIIDFAQKNKHHFPIVGLSMDERQIKERIENMKKMRRNNGKIRKVVGAVIIAAAVSIPSITTLAYQPRQTMHFDRERNGAEVESCFLVGVTFEHAFDREYSFCNELDMRLHGYEDYITADHDTFFVDEDGNVYYDIFTDADEIRNYRACNHTYKSGMYSTHDTNSSGGCTITYYQGKRCTQCGHTILEQRISSLTYDICPH